MSLILQKYGGTSVGSPERIRSVADRIARCKREGNDVAVVVSAMGHTTDELISLALQVSKQPPHREMDMLLTAGERISMALLSMALADQNVPAISFTGSQSGIITDQSHRRARITRILGDRIRAALKEGKVPIVAGFQGVSETKEITTLGRGGSDTTAVALAAALKAEACEIYTDVDGVYSADPRIVPGARLWKTVPYDLMIEMATRGAGVLHPRSVELAKQFGVKLKVRNSLNENEGTVLLDNQALKNGMEEFKVTGVSSDRGRMLLQVQLYRPALLGALWDRAAKAHLSIVSPVFSDGKVELFIERDSEEDWKKHLDELVALGFVKASAFRSEMVPVSVVGERFAQDGAGLYEVIETLSREQVAVSMGVASSLAITVAVPAEKAAGAVAALHKKFLE
jgi:aspartate kinase